LLGGGVARQHECRTKQSRQRLDLTGHLWNGRVGHTDEKPVSRLFWD
jgi:hypothetical protein